VKKEEKRGIVMADTLFCSHATKDIKIPRSGLRISRICIDMTGWRDSSEKGRSIVEKGGFPYSLEFRDADGKTVTMLSSRVDPEGMRDLMETAADMGIIPASGTFVEITCPAENIRSYRVVGNRAYGTKFSTGLEQFNEYGLDTMTFTLKGGACQEHLESVLDQVLHTWAQSETTRTVRRHAPFSQSVYQYHDEDNARLDGSRSGPAFGDAGGR
jgi:hypothetical protein